MKRLIATVLTLIVLTIAAVPAGAQTRERRSYRRAQQAAQTRAYDDGYDNGQYQHEDDRSIWEKHRDKITTAAGAGAGALLGAVVGGKKGAIIGAAAGGGGAAIYTYGIRDKNEYRYRRPY